MSPVRGRCPVVLLVGGLLLGGCNVFDVSSFQPDTVDALVADADAALTNGNASRAVQLLERIFDKDTTDVRVRVELGNALYAKHGLDVFALRTAAGHLVELSGTSKGAAATRPVRNENVCTDGARPETAPERYKSILLDADPLHRLVDRTSVVERVRGLVVEGVLERRPEAFASARPNVRRKGLLVGAVTAVAKEVIDVHAVFDTTGSSLYLDREAESHRALVACAETDGRLAQAHDALCALETAARRGVQWLQDRAPPPEEEQGSVLTERLQTLADAADARVDCP